MWLAEFVEERFPTTCAGVWVEGCLTTEDAVCSLPADWSLIVATLGGPGKDYRDLYAPEFA